MNDSMGDRLKSYEKMETSQTFIPLLPVYARIDGRGFSRFTKGMQRPYDENMSNAMVEVTKYLVGATGATVGYTQSDEISLMWYAEDFKSQLFFAGKKQKMVSTLAAMATAKFMQEVLWAFPERFESLPTFDARVFQLPNKEEAMNCFLWRVKDAVKNSISMAASCHYSHKELMNKNSSQKIEMLYNKGILWQDYPMYFKNGTFVKRVESMITTQSGVEVPRHRVESMCVDFNNMDFDSRMQFIFSKVV